jgi:polysaccharide biosynthesis/export protein
MNTLKFSYIQFKNNLFIKLIIALLLLSQFVFSAKADEINPEASSVMPVFYLGAGDKLRIHVRNHPDLSLTIPINPNGKINFPLIGELTVAGKTETEFEKSITSKLRAHIRNPQVSVTLMEVRSFRVFVIGEVIHSGLFSVKGAVTVSQAIAMAGGFTPFADKSDILIFNQKKGRNFHFDFKDFVKHDSGISDIFLEAGDTVFVN